jgi:hypothetical protein
MIYEPRVNHSYQVGTRDALSCILSMGKQAENQVFVLFYNDLKSMKISKFL